MIEAIETTSPHQAASGDLFKPITILVILIIGVISFGAFLALSGFESDLQNKDNGRSHALSSSPNGYAALVKLLDSQPDVYTKLEREPESKWLEPEAVRIYTAPRPRMSESLADIWIDVPSLFVVPKRIVTKSREQRERYKHNGLWNVATLERDYKFLDETLVVERLEGSSSRFEMAFDRADEIEIPDIVVSELQYIAGDALTPVIQINGKAVLARVKETQTFILSDPDLLENSAMKDYAGAKFAIQILELIATETQAEDLEPDEIYHQFYFDLTLHGMGGNQNFIKLLLQPPFLAATLCLLMTGLLLAWRAFTRFGAPHKSVRAFALGKQALANNSADLIRLAGREPNMAPGYAALIRKLTARFVRLPKTLGTDDAIATLDKIGKRAGAKQSLADMTAEANAIENSSQLMTLAKQLYSWREEITDESK